MSDLTEAFWSKVDRTGPCWLWRAATNSSGYGTFAGRMAHRVAYEMVVGSIPRGLHLDHLCRTRLCVRPQHLEPVTPKENTERSWSARGGRNTHCGKGHEFTEANTYRHPRDGGRRCRACNADDQQRRRDRVAAPITVETTHPGNPRPNPGAPPPVPLPKPGPQPIPRPGMAAA